MVALPSSTSSIKFCNWARPTRQGTHLPQVWAWKPKRVAKVERYCDTLASILPFDSKFYHRSQYVGHPLLDEIDIQKNSYNKNSIISFMPGSRRSEISRLMPLYKEVAKNINGKKLLGKDEMLERIAAGDAASLAARKASRLSDTHWKLVYLLQNPEKTYKAYCIDHIGKDARYLIPELDMQTVIGGAGEDPLNYEAELKAERVDIPTQDVRFIRL